MNDQKAAARMRLNQGLHRSVSPPCSTGGGATLRKEQLLALARDGDTEAASDLWREFGIQTGAST